MIDHLAEWLDGLERRHLADLRFSEVTRALRAVSAGYVERRATLNERSAFDGAGKRAAYALYYGPLHFLTVRHIVHALPGAAEPLAQVIDWGCGTGAAGAAWASAMQPPAHVRGVDHHPWALTEAAATYKAFRLDADVTRDNLGRLRGADRDPASPRQARGLILGWVLNEVRDEIRGALLEKLLDAASRGARVLIIEPIATRVSPWWPEWVDAFAAIGGRADEWRFDTQLPDLVRRLDRAAGMRHDQLKARSLWAAVRR